MHRPFDPLTGDWIPVPPAPPPAWPDPAVPLPAFEPVDPEDARTDAVATVWNAILIADLALLGLALLIGAAGLLANLGQGDATAQYTLEQWQILLAVEAGANLVLMGVIPLLWARYTRAGGWAGAQSYLGLRTPARSLAIGVGLGIACLAALTVVGVIVRATGWAQPSAQTLLIERAVTWPLAVALSIGAAVGEEVLFRGVLQRRIGWVWQAVVFGLFHLTYGTVLQIAFPFALGLLFGWLRKRGMSLFVPMAAHFVFDFVQLGAAVLCNTHPTWSGCR